MSPHGLDGNAALALQVHVVQDLVFHVAQRDRFRLFQYAVRQLLLPWSMWAMMLKFRIRSRGIAK